jgi:SAM-dependent methyltransferase
MTHDFDKDYWDQHWQDRAPEAREGGPPNPYLIAGASGLTPGSALDAGCGAGAEAIWLAGEGWTVTAADISSDALGRAGERALASGVADRVEWVEADLTAWSPDTQYELVTTHYAHPAMPQLAFYERIADWVASSGTLLIVGHLHTHESTGHGHHGPAGHSHDNSAGHGQEPPAEASVRAADITALLRDEAWVIVTADETLRTVTAPTGNSVDLRDVVVQATRRS